mmetsp:Transcript_4809/g.6743  ORF Transcript_4809/g.6743 Transcript_4809/m.6743 type:complete len:205 (+) Transcript_4809:511-1125(+)
MEIIVIITVTITLTIIIITIVKVRSRGISYAHLHRAHVVADLVKIIRIRGLTCRCSCSCIRCALHILDFLLPSSIRIPLQFDTYFDISLLRHNLPHDFERCSIFLGYGIYGSKFARINEEFYSLFVNRIVTTVAFIISVVVVVVYQCLGLSDQILIHIIPMATIRKHQPKLHLGPLYLQYSLHLNRLDTIQKLLLDTPRTDWLH